MGVKTESYSASQLIESGALIINDGFRAKNSQLNKRSGIPFARAGNINNGFDFTDADLVDDEEATKAGIKVSQPGDVVFTSKGTVGRFAFVVEETQTFIYSPQLCFWRVVDHNLIDPRFLYYWMHSPDFINQIHALKGQTDMADYVSLRDQRSMKITLPDIAVQSTIAGIVGALDQKIEINRQTNQTLESMAQALFKSWFVDFDPIIDNALVAGNEIPEPLAAKAAARRALQEQGADKANQPHTLPDHIRQLFPSRFQFTEELGWIPEGWSVGSFSDFAHLNPESWSSKTAPPTVKYIDLSNVKSGAILEVNEYTFKGAPSRARRVLRAGDSIVGTVRPGNRSFAYIDREGLTGSTGFAVLRPKKCDYNAFVYFGVTQESVIDELARLADGAAYPAVRPDVVSQSEIIVPSNEILSSYQQLTAPLLERSAENERSNETLAKIRDTLLPKLLSGELRIPEAESKLEAALT